MEGNYKMTIIAIIQARTGSTRLPGKVLLDLQGKTVLEHVIDRVKMSRHINKIVVATTIRTEDLEIVKLCANIGTNVYCGSEDDVLDRYYQASRLFEADTIVRITSDCPLIDSNIIDEVISKYLSENADYSSNTLNETYPDGLDAEVFSFDALRKAWKNANTTSDREHVTPYIKKNPDDFKLVSLEYRENLSEKRWTLDRQEDYEFIKEIYINLYCKNPLFAMKDILEFISNNPEIETINQHIARNEGYFKSRMKDKILDIDYMEDKTR